MTYMTYIDSANDVLIELQCGLVLLHDLFGPLRALFPFGLKNESKDNKGGVPHLSLRFLIIK